MSNLNEGVLDDIDSSEHAEDFEFVEPKTSNTNAPNLDLVIPDKNNGLTEDRPPTAEELFGPNVKPGEVPNIEAEFKTIDEHQQKIVNLEEVEAAIIGSDGISKESAEHFNQYFPGFLDKIPLNRFTKLPTKVHYGDFLQYSKEAIDAAKTEVSTLSSEFIISMSNAVEAYEDYLEDKAIPYIENQLEIINATYGDFIARVNAESKILVPVTKIKPDEDPEENTVERHQLNKVQFIDLLQFPIYDFDHNIVEVPKLKAFGYKLVRFMSGMYDIKPAIMAPELLYFISTDYGLNDGLISKELVYAQKPRMNEVSLKDIFMFYNSNGVKERLGDLLKLIEVCGDAVENLTNEMSQRGFINVSGNDDNKTIAPIQNSDYSALNAFLTEKKLMIDSVIFTYNYVRESTHHITLLNNGVIDIVPALITLS